MATRRRLVSILCSVLLLSGVLLLPTAAAPARPRFSGDRTGMVSDIPNMQTSSWHINQRPDRGGRMNQLSDTAICLGLPLFSAISLIIMLIALIRLFSKGPRKRSPTLREMVTTMDVDGIVRALSTGDLDRRIVTARNFIRAISGRIGAVGIDWENFISNPRFVEPIIDLLQMLHTMVGWRDHKEIFIRFLGGIGDTRAVEP